MSTHTTTPAPQTIELIRRLLEAAHRPEPANDPTICAICGAPLTDTTSSICPDHVSLYDIDPKVLRMHLDNGLLDTVMETEPEEFGYANVARNLSEFLNTEASQYVLHPAGTNVDYDIDVLTNQLGPHLHPDWLRQLTNHRKLDLSTYRISDLALDHNPYQNHAGTHRVQDCIRRDRNDYANYLDIMRAGIQGARS